MAARHPIQDIRDAVCLDAYKDGWTTEELSEAIGVTTRTVRRWIKRAGESADHPDLELWMNGAGKACIHHRPIVRGMPVLCLDCDVTGIPEHPAFRRKKYSEPAKEAAKFKPKGLEHAQSEKP